MMMAVKLMINLPRNRALHPPRTRRVISRARYSSLSLSLSLFLAFRPWIRIAIAIVRRIVSYLEGGARPVATRTVSSSE